MRVKNQLLRKTTYKTLRVHIFEEADPGRNTHLRITIKSRKKKVPFLEFAAAAFAARSGRPLNAAEALAVLELMGESTREGWLTVRIKK